MVGRPSVRLVLGADEGAVLDPGDVSGVGERQVGVGALGVVETLEGAGVDQGLSEGVVLLSRAVAPVDGVVVGAVAAMVWLIRRTLLIGLQAGLGEIMPYQA